MGPKMEAHKVIEIVEEIQVLIDRLVDGQDILNVSELNKIQQKMEDWKSFLEYKTNE